MKNRMCLRRTIGRARGQMAQEAWQHVRGMLPAQPSWGACSVHVKSTMRLRGERAVNLVGAARLKWLGHQGWWGSLGRNGRAVTLAGLLCHDFAGVEPRRRREISRSNLKDRRPGHRCSEWGFQSRVQRIASIICLSGAPGSVLSGPWRQFEACRSSWLAGEPHRNFQKSFRKTASLPYKKPRRAQAVAFLLHAQSESKPHSHYSLCDFS